MEVLYRNTVPLLSLLPRVRVSVRGRSDLFLPSSLHQNAESRLSSSSTMEFLACSVVRDTKENRAGAHAVSSSGGGGAVV